MDFTKNGYQLCKLTIFEHTGTHIDAPLHFSDDGTSVADLPPEQPDVPALHHRHQGQGEGRRQCDGRDRPISRPGFRANGEIPAGACVAMNSGWAAKVGDASYRNTPDGKFAFPGFSKAATDMLAELEAAAIGVDTLSLDPGNSADFAVHFSWLPGGRYGIENLANLDAPAASGRHGLHRRAQAQDRHRRPGPRDGGDLMATVPLLSDAEAAPEARAVFDDIRAKRDTDYVNNFWRALAADPALLQRDVGAGCRRSWHPALWIR